MAWSTPPWLDDDFVDFWRDEFAKRDAAIAAGTAAELDVKVWAKEQQLIDDGVDGVEFWSALRKYRYDQERYYANRKREVARALVNANKRYAAKMKRVPPWFDADKAKEIYDLAAEFRAAGFEVDVDHIVPLQGTEVSGLHWHGNLRVCLASVNRSKNNRMSAHHGD